MTLQWRQLAKTGSSRTRSSFAPPTKVCANESRAASEPDQSIPFLCECIDETCMARIDLTPQEYEVARSDDQWFVIAPGHPRLEGERIVEEDDHFLIVTKEDVG